MKTTLRKPLRTWLIMGLSICAVGAARADDSVQVTAANYVRAETDFQMKDYVDKYGCFAKFHHFRDPYDVHNQVTIRANRDTLYSVGVFDLRSPLNCAS